MIVEFIGSTGAGKTTLISQVERRLTPTANVTTSFDVITSQVGLSRVRNPSARNIIQEVIGFSYLLRSLPRYKEIIDFSLRMLARKSDSIIFKLNNLRSMVRKLGVYEIIRRRQGNQIVFVDEGTVLLAHVLFVYNRAYYTADEIKRFSSLVPLPNLIVYVKAPVDCIVKRTLERPSPPRELRSRNQALIEKNVNDAVTMFDQLIATEELRDRVLIVENPESSNKRCDAAADLVADFIRSYQALA